ncbi:MAG: hypothetical protein IMF18_08745 [Proteobacteria bacterium]|nr:hypothetical protein [Pseudomonadota bacterium]
MENDFNFNMYAEKMSGAIRMRLSGPLDASRALDVLCFLDLYARGRQPIIMDTSDMSSDNKFGLDVLKKGLQRLSDLGHPILDYASEELALGDEQT